MNKDFLFKSKLSTAGIYITCVQNELERCVMLLISFENNYITQLRIIGITLLYI